MTTTTPKAHRITPGAVIPFPCWAYCTSCEKWHHIEIAQYWVADIYSHWHPDQPTAPTSIPSPVSSQDSEGTAPDAIDEVIAEVYRLFGKPTDRDDMMQAEVLLRTMLTEKFSAAPRPNQPAQEAAERQSPKSVPCPHCGDTLLWSEDRGAHCDGCDDFDPETDLPNLPAPSPGASGEVREALADLMKCLSATSGVRLLPDNRVALEFQMGGYDELVAVRERARAILALSKPAAPMLPGGEPMKRDPRVSAALNALISDAQLNRQCAAQCIHASKAKAEYQQRADELEAGVRALEELSAPPLPGGTLVDGKAGERLRWVENHLQQTGDAPTWDDNGFWHVRINGKNITGTEFTHCIDDAMSAQADAGRDEPPASDAGREEGK